LNPDNASDPVLPDTSTRVRDSQLNRTEFFPSVQLLTFTPAMANLWSVTLKDICRFNEHLGGNSSNPMKIQNKSIVILRRFPALVLLMLTWLVIPAAQAALWSTNRPMNSTHLWHTATLLPNGKVLVAGGATNYDAGYHPTAIAELYDPAIGAWTATDPMTHARESHTSTLLPNGKVLVAGGLDDGSSPLLSSAELYDPATGTWSPTSSMSFTRSSHSATLLPNGRVLVAAGFGRESSFTTAELYDPSNQTWTVTGNLHIPRQEHSATLLPNGKVLVVGGANPQGFPIAGVELYDPASGLWTVCNPLNKPRSDFTTSLLPDGKVLVAGGYTTNGTINSAEIYDPITDSWTFTAPMNWARTGHTASLLPNGKVLVSGGDFQSPSTSELYDPIAKSWTASAALTVRRSNSSATLLANGQVLVVGGYSMFPEFLATSEIYDPATDPATGSWTNTSPLSVAREYHTATLLPNGKALIAGGWDSNSIPLANVDVYNPASGTWTATQPLNIARLGHTTTLLPNGNVLVVGGIDNSANGTASTELYDPASETWTISTPLNTKRTGHTATLLPNGLVLVAGGDNTTNSHLSSAELYNPTTGIWTPTGSLITGRQVHTALLLTNGQVLVVGGIGGSALSSAELYDPATGMWTATGGLNVTRTLYTATLLPNGRVLVVGGGGVGDVLSSAELYDPTTGEWTMTGSLNTARYAHIATLLPNGKAMVSGGYDLGRNPLSSAELYDPSTGKWLPTGGLDTAVAFHTATLLPDGKVLVVGGEGSSNNIDIVLTNTALYDVGLDFSNSWQPQITSITSNLHLGDSLTITGSQSRGISEASGGTDMQISASDHPLVQLRSIESGQSTFLLVTNWSTNVFNSAPIYGFPPGYAMVTVFVNGIPSTSSFVNISVPIPVAARLTSAVQGTNGFQITFTNTVGALFGVLTTTNTVLPLTNWTTLGGVKEVSPGHFQFTDAQMTNGPQRFYRLRSLSTTPPQ
jgi:N-acetylneuraminic acid mutarotase